MLMYDPVLKCMEKGEKVEEITQACEELKKTQEEKNNFESKKKQLQESVAKEKLEKKQLEEYVKELEKTISQYLDAFKEAGRKAVEDFKATDGKEHEDKANNITTSTIIYNIYFGHPRFNFSFLGKDIVEFVRVRRQTRL
ncbi:hypothetical protein PanWU01x14_094600 [Parasponia andersonii]|uniref:Uncharacterized protein n=1 Tax=Parasponia andersonii TaxID=3476 RepID=A0A2P5D5B2_PARAD|nr:hypothetical protein PanWU01x14_094600 [Parasponia andersonii]